MAKKKAQNLNLANLQKEEKNIVSQTEHTLVINGSDYKVKIEDKFLKTKQHALLDDLVSFFNESNSRIELLELATPYTTLLLIKHFSSIDVPDGIDEGIEVLNVLINLEILGTILNLMPDSEVNSVYELISATVDRMTENIKEAEKEADRLSGIVENQEVKDLLLDGKKGE